MQTQTSSLQMELKLRKTNSWWKKPLTWVGVVVVVGGGVAYWVVQQNGQKGQTAGVQIRWVSVGRGTVSQTVSLSGTLNPANEVTVTGSGKLLSVSVKVGDKVAKGQVIAQTDSTSYQSQLLQAQAQLAQAEAKLAQSKESVTSTQVPGKGQPTAQAPDPYVIAQAQASVNQAQAQVEAVQQQIAACTITAPISGTVLEAVQPNQSTTSSGNGGGNANSSSIAVIADLTPSNYVVQATVPQSDAAGIHAGQSAVVSLSATGSDRVTGKVDSIGYMPQTQGGVTMYPVTIDVDAPDTSVTLLPGESVSVTVTKQQANNVLTLPTAAVTQRRGQTGVYVASDTAGASNASSNTPSGFAAANGIKLPSNLAFLPVTVGLYGGNSVEVKNGLSEGQQVAVLIPPASTSSSSTSTRGSNGFGMMSGFGGGMGGFGGSRGNYGGGGGGGGKSQGSRSGGGGN